MYLYHKGENITLEVLTIYNEKYVLLSSISLILKNEGFFRSENTFNEISIENVTTNSACQAVQSTTADNKIGLIMTLSMGLLGILLLVQGFLRDHISFGVCRLVTYILLTLTYLFFAIAKPNHSDSLQETYSTNNSKTFY